MDGESMVLEQEVASAEFGDTRLNEVIREIASLGGHVPRSKTEPGTQTL